MSAMRGRYHGHGRIRYGGWAYGRPGQRYLVEVEVLVYLVSEEGSVKELSCEE